MAHKTYFDQIVTYPLKIINQIGEDKYCVGLLRNKPFDSITDDDKDAVYEENLFNYMYVDNTVTETSAYVCVEMEVPRVENKHVKDAKIYVTIACHKNYMQLNGSIFPGVLGNRRDNLVRYIDKLLNSKMLVGIGELNLVQMNTLTPVNNFTMRELVYKVADFNLVDIADD